MKVSTSEESSIIDDAEVEGHNLDTASSQGNKALINNTYRSVMSTLSRSNRNLQVTFAQLQKFHTVFVLTTPNANDQAENGGLYVKAARNTSVYSCDNNSKLFDSGFIGCNRGLTYTGVRISLQKATVAALRLMEVRVYQCPEMISSLQSNGATVKIDAPPPKSPEYAATNLISNLDNRRTRNDLPQMMNENGDKATSKQSCYMVTDAQLASLNDQLVITIDLGEVIFMHAILIVQDLWNGGMLHNSHSNTNQYFQNYQIYIGKSATYSNNSLCAGGPFMKVGDTKSYANAYYTSADGTKYSNEPFWRYGQEHWCNLQGQYMSIVADLGHLAGQTYEMSLCTVGIMGTKYITTGSRQQTITVQNSNPCQDSLIVWDKILSQSEYEVVNDLYPEIRQKPGSELSWVQTSSDALQHTITIAACQAPTGQYTAKIESYDNNSSVKSTLFDNEITITVANCDTIQVNSVIDTNNDIVMIKEYEITINYPDVIFEPSPKTSSNFCWGTTYDNDLSVNSGQLKTQKDGMLLTVPADVERKSHQISFTGTQQPTPQQTVHKFTTLIQQIRIMSVMRIEYLDQPKLTPDSFSFSIAPGALGAQKVDASEIKVSYAFKSGDKDVLGNTPPAVYPEPFTGFSASDITLGKPSLGKTTLDNPTGVLTNDPAGKIKDGETLNLVCPDWILAKMGTTEEHSQEFENDEKPIFKATLLFTCTYENSTPPSFAEQLPEIKIEPSPSGAQEWILPRIIEGSLPLFGLYLEAEEPVAPFISIQQPTETETAKISFNGDLAIFQAAKIKDTFVLKLRLENTFGQQNLVKVEIKVCLPSLIGFQTGSFSLIYEIGSGMIPISLPEVKQVPNCKMDFSSFRIRETVSAIEATKLQAAVQFDQKTQLLKIETDDYSLNGYTAMVRIMIAQDLVNNAEDYEVLISFETEKPKFNMTGFEVDPITCSLQDGRWKMILPEITTTEISPVRVAMLPSSDFAQLFSLANDIVIINSKQLSGLTSAQVCPQQSMLALDFMLISDLLGKNEQTIRLPVAPVGNGGPGFQGVVIEELEANSIDDELQNIGNFKPDDEEPLRINIIKISPTGVLQLSFSKPILPLPFDSFNESGKQRNLRKKEAITIDQVIRVEIEDEEKVLDKSIKYIQYIQSDERSLKVQVSFSDTKTISPDILFPDQLLVNVTRPELFVDASTGKALAEAPVIKKLPVSAQYTKEEYKVLQEQAQKAAQISIAVTIWELVIIFLFKKVLFSMWVLILILQYFVYIATWQVRYPSILTFILFELKRIALGEFMDDFDFGKQVMTAFGMDPKQESATEEKLGKERLGGSSNVFTSFGATLLLGSLVFLIIILMLVAIILISRRVKVSDKNRERIKKLKRKIFFNPIVRYLLLNSLKLNMSGFVVFITFGAQVQDQIIAVLILIAVNGAPIPFYFAVKRNKGNLESDEVKQSFGTIYAGKNVTDQDHKAHLYPFTFFMRRAAFIAATVFLFDYPLMQMYAHFVLTMTTMAILVNKSRAYETRKQRVVEVGTEFLMHLTCIAQSAFMDARINEDQGKKLETITLVFFSVLVLLNISFILIVVIQDCKSKLRLKAWEKRKKVYEEVVQKKKQAARELAKKKKREHLKQLKARKKAIKREKIKLEKERKAAMLQQEIDKKRAIRLKLQQDLEAIPEDESEHSWKQRRQIKRQMYKFQKQLHPNMQQTSSNFQSDSAFESQSRSAVLYDADVQIKDSDRSAKNNLLNDSSLFLTDSEAENSHRVIDDQYDRTLVEDPNFISHDQQTKLTQYDQSRTPNMAGARKLSSATNIEPTVDFLSQQFDNIVSQGKKIKESDIFHELQHSFESSDIERNLEDNEEFKFSKVPVKVHRKNQDISKN